MNDYLGWVVLIFCILLILVYFSYRKNRFLTIKRKYGITVNAPYDFEHLTRLLLNYNENSTEVLGIKDYTFINIDGSPFPLVHGVVSNSKNQMESSSGSSWAYFVLVQGSNFVNLALKYQDIFELGGEQKGISVYWVKDLQRLSKILIPTKNQDS